eukprot:scaffold71364_cov55-Phaeocystis_antarctica.AAC.1
MKAPTEPGSGMCRKESDMKASSGESRSLPRPIEVTMVRARGPALSLTAAAACPSLMSIA